MRDIVYDSKACTGCSACSQACPCGAAAMEADDEGFLFPRINEELCSDCGLCRRICPVNKTADRGSFQPGFGGMRAFACYSKNDDIRGRSSSGGIFSELAIMTLSNGGVVFGAAFDADFNVMHRFIDGMESLDDIRRSKYVQSDTSNTYRQAGGFLDRGVKVLFCGTPCQIAGLKSFLGRDYENLIACDLACYGVPSPAVWRMFLDYQRRRYNSPIKYISFRDKSAGWKANSMNISFANGERYLVKTNEELYFMGFSKNIFNRRSCFGCRFRIQNSSADITLADFWGIGKMDIGLQDDDRGVSLAIAHSAAGEKALAEIGDRIALAECDVNEAVRYNPRLYCSAAEPAGRSAFFADMKNGFDFDMLRRKYMDNSSLKYKLKRMVKKILGRG